MSSDKKLDLFTLVDGSQDTSDVELVRIGNDEAAVILFTSEIEEAVLHYCSEPDLSSYVFCNGADCVLCQIGRKQERRYLLPVFQPTSGQIGILPVSPSLRPHALLPQLLHVLKAEGPQVVFVRRENMSTFIVSSHALPGDVDSGEIQIKRFVSMLENGDIDLTSVYPRIDNEHLRSIPELACILKLKGIEPDASD